MRCLTEWDLMDVTAERERESETSYYLVFFFSLVVFL